MAKIKVMVVDDHEILRQGLSALIANEASLTLVAQAATGQQAVELARKHRPDVITMDIGLPDINGIEATTRILKDHPETRIIALSMHSDRKYLQAIFRAGGRGFLHKECAFPELVQAIMTVHRGYTYLGKALTDIMFVDLLGGGIVPGGVLQLSQREAEVLKLLADEFNTKSIADRMGVSVKTVETYQRRLKVKLGIKTAVGLVKYAIGRGMSKL